MNSSETGIQEKLVEVFRLEARERLESFEEGLAQLEDDGPSRDRIEAVFREMHSLKGAAGAVRFESVEHEAHRMESLLAEAKADHSRLSPKTLKTLRAGLEKLKAELAAGPDDGSGARAGAAASTVRISSGRLDRLLVEAEELIGNKVAAREHVESLRRLRTYVDDWRRQMHVAGNRIRGSAAARDPGAVPDPAWLSRTREFTEGLTREIEIMLRTALEDERNLDRTTDALLEDMKTALMLPFSSLTESMRRTARDIAREQGKRVAVRIEGAGAEADRRILEEIHTPLTHLIRNAVDHGIEPPEDREAQGKRPEGTIGIDFRQVSADSVEILVEDDGRGLDLHAIAERSRSLGLREESASVADLDWARDAVFESGVSTSPIITNISGRGLGLAIVRETVDRLQGAIRIESEPGHGVRFRLTIPTTLVAYRALPVTVGEETYILPASAVRTAVRIDPDRVRTIDNRRTLLVDGMQVPLVCLSDVLGRGPVSPGGGTEFSAGVVLGSGDRRVAFEVDEVGEEQEVLVKALGPQLAGAPNLAGVTILRGRVVPILNAGDLLVSARQIRDRPTPEVPPAIVPEQRSILVAEDSITARSLLKGILETAGYNVDTAVDGQDALAKLRVGDFDLLVSDVDMPRMNGLDLTAEVRSAERLKEMPVVLVTSLGSREDRERGVEVGANAYLVKSSFDQSDLLDAVERLL